jgi:hypothetical protein
MPGTIWGLGLLMVSRVESSTVRRDISDEKNELNGLETIISMHNTSVLSFAIFSLQTQAALSHDE